MCRIKVLKVCFNGSIEGHEIPALRGAISAKAGRDNLLFHNHDGDSFRYRYPLIQYKRFGRKPAIVCVGEGVDHIHKFFEKRDWSLEISGRTLDMKVERLDLNQYELSVSNRDFHYSLQSWLPLNQENYVEYMRLPAGEDNRRYLERKLTGNMLSFAKGVDWHVEQPIETEILDMAPPYMVTLKGVRLLAFNLTFRSNVFLPDGIGLGKGVSLGFGVLRKQHPTETPANTHERP